MGKHKKEVNRVKLSDISESRFKKMENDRIADEIFGSSKPHEHETTEEYLARGGTIQVIGLCKKRRKK